MNSGALNSVSSNDSNIRVIARFRPQNSIEDREGGVKIVNIDDSGTSCRVESKEYPGQFNFDRIFSWNCRQNEIFEECGLPLVQQSFEGFNSTLFCYGQTGSGKTYTMMGGDINDDKAKGMTPRLLEKIFSTIQESADNLEFTVKVSFMEIYMEKIRDLLMPSSDNLPVHEDKTRGIYVKGLKEVYVSSLEEVYQILQVGDQARSVSATNMNETSSRSHSIFAVFINQKDINSGVAKTGKMYLVDLAGSEKVGKTGATGQTLEEAKKINKSLTALGMVINALTDGKSSHIPYRDSKLTRILQESLGGNAKTTLIVNCSPSSYNDAETISTLRFATRAKSIKNSAHINVELSASELKSLLKSANSELGKLRSYVKRLETEVQVWRSGGTVEAAQFASADATPSTSQMGSLVSIGGSPVTVSSDEREEFLKRENDLIDQLAEKESALDSNRQREQGLMEEIERSQESEKHLANENKQLLHDHAQIKGELEKLAFQQKEDKLTIENLTEKSNQLEEQLAESFKSQVQSPASAPLEPDLDRIKKEKTAEMLKTLSSAEYIDDSLDPKSENRYAQALELIEKLSVQNSSYEERVKKLEEEMAELLDGAIAGEEAKDHAEKIASSLHEFKSSLEEEFSEKKRLLENELVDRNKKLESKETELKEIQTELDGLKLTSTSASTESIRQQMMKQMQEFETVKKSLMRDIQDRCQKVVELEILLDESNERYEKALRDTNGKAQQKKVQFLERNIEQLTKNQKQIFSQNAELQRQLRVGERKIKNRDERIDDLEKILQDLSTKMGIEQEKHDIDIQRQKARIRELEDANDKLKIGIHVTEGRIAKPLRGGAPATSDSQKE